MWNICGKLNKPTYMCKQTIPNGSHNTGDTESTVVSLDMRFSIVYPNSNNTYVGRMFIDVINKSMHIKQIYCDAWQ